MSCEVAKRNGTAKRMENYDSGGKKETQCLSHTVEISFWKIFFILGLLLIFVVVFPFFFCSKYVVKNKIGIMWKSTMYLSHLSSGIKTVCGLIDTEYFKK